VPTVVSKTIIDHNGAVGFEGNITCGGIKVIFDVPYFKRYCMAFDILVVDDEKDIRDLIAGILENPLFDFII
jgi:hypothetical protein